MPDASKSAQPTYLSLQPGSGIWFETLDARIDPSVWIDRSFVERQSGRGREASTFLQVVLDDSTAKRDYLGRRSAPPKGAFRFTATQCIDAFLDHWVPIPYLRGLGGDERGADRHGPTRWARVLIMKGAGSGSPGDGYRVALAFDTNHEPAEHPPGAPVDSSDLRPSYEDVQRATSFEFVYEGPFVEAFARQTWINEQIQEAYLATRAARQRSTASEDVANEPRPLEPTACYLTLLSVLSQTCEFPKVRFQAKVTAIEATPITAAPGPRPIRAQASASEIDAMTGTGLRRHRRITGSGSNGQRPVLATAKLPRDLSTLADQLAPVHVNGARATADAMMDGLRRHANGSEPGKPVDLAKLSAELADLSQAAPGEAHSEFIDHQAMAVELAAAAKTSPASTTRPAPAMAASVTSPAKRSERWTPVIARPSGLSPRDAEISSNSRGGNDQAQPNDDGQARSQASRDERLQGTTRLGIVPGVGPNMGSGMGPGPRVQETSGNPAPAPPSHALSRLTSKPEGGQVAGTSATQPPLPKAMAPVAPAQLDDVRLNSHAPDRRLATLTNSGQPLREFAHTATQPTASPLRLELPKPVAVVPPSVTRLEHKSAPDVPAANAARTMPDALQESPRRDAKAQGWVIATIACLAFALGIGSSLLWIRAGVCLPHGTDCSTVAMSLETTRSVAIALPAPVAPIAAPALMPPDAATVPLAAPSGVLYPILESGTVSPGGVDAKGLSLTQTIANAEQAWSGAGLPADIEETAFWLRRVAALSSSPLHRGALNRLGKLYALGGTKLRAGGALQASVIASALFEAAANEGSIEALCNLSTLNGAATLGEAPEGSAAKIWSDRAGSGRCRAAQGSPPPTKK